MPTPLLCPAQPLGKSSQGNNRPALISSGWLGLSGNSVELGGLRIMTQLRGLAQRDQSPHRARNSFDLRGSVAAVPSHCSVTNSSRSWPLTNAKGRFLPQRLKSSLCYLFTHLTSSCYFEPMFGYSAGKREDPCCKSLPGSPWQLYFWNVPCM